MYVIIKVSSESLVGGNKRVSVTSSNQLNGILIGHVTITFHSIARRREISAPNRNYRSDGTGKASTLTQISK